MAGRCTWWPVEPPRRLPHGFGRPGYWPPRLRIEEGNTQRAGNDTLLSGEIKKICRCIALSKLFPNKRPVMGTATLTIGQFRLRSVGCGSPTPSWPPKDRRPQGLTGTSVLLYGSFPVYGFKAAMRMTIQQQKTATPKLKRASRKQGSIARHFGGRARPGHPRLGGGPKLRANRSRLMRRCLLSDAAGPLPVR